MNYTEIKKLALGYANRIGHVEVEDGMDDFIKMVESRINNKLKIMDMSSEGVINVTSEVSKHDLPDDYNGYRHAHLISNGETVMMHSATPLFITGIFGKSVEKLYYSVVSNQIRTSKNLKIGDEIILDYYKKVPNLSVSNPTNWASDNNPYCYVFGLLVEICSFTKDIEHANLWDARFKESIDDISFIDNSKIHSGQTLVTMLG